MVYEACCQNEDCTVGMQMLTQLEILAHNHEEH